MALWQTLVADSTGAAVQLKAIERAQLLQTWQGGRVLVGTQRQLMEQLGWRKGDLQHQRNQPQNRQQRDQEQRARADSERRMYREAGRVELLTVLQARMRSVAEDEIHESALRLMLEHLRMVVPIDAGLAVVRGHNSRDALVGWPLEARDAIVDRTLERLSMLRQRLGLSNDFNSQPGLGVEELDTSYFTRLVLNWK